MLRVPPGYRESFTQLATIDPADADHLLSGFEASPDTSRGAAVRSVVQASGQNETFVGTVFDSAVTLIRTLQDSDEDQQEAPSNLASDPALDLDDEHREALTQRMRRLLSSRPVRLLAKAIDLQADHEALFRNARMYLEVRPMFDEDLAQAPVAAAVVHKLKIEYFDKSLNVAHFFLALDNDDLRRLDEVVQRQLAKIPTAEAYLTSANSHIIDYNGED